MIVGINGPINSGKSTVAKLLNRDWEKSLFIEVDDLLSDKEAKDLKLDFMGQVNERLRRLRAKIAELIQTPAAYEHMIFAYPLTERNYEDIKAIVPDDVKFIVVTLRPLLEVCQSNRGERELDDWEKNRIKEMYDMDIVRLEKSDLIINNSFITPEQTANLIKEYLCNIKIEASHDSK